MAGEATTPALAGPTEWSVPMTAMTATEGSNLNLELGTNAGATDDYDSGLDVPHPPPGPAVTFDAYFSITDPLFSQLDKDYQASADSIQWTLHLESSSEDITLIWDISGLPADYSLTLSGAGPDIDMKAIPSTVLGTGIHSLTIIAAGVPANTPPVLSGGVVIPDPAYVTTLFAYSMTYTDGDNDSPTSIAVSIDGSAPQDMSVKAGEDGDYRNGEVYEYTTSGLAKDVSHTFRLAASDGTDDATGDIGVHDGPTVVNTPPTAAVADVTPDAPATSDDLLSSITTPSTDADGDTVTYSYAWYKNDVLQPALTTNTVLAANTAEGETWRSEVTPDDGTTNGPTGQDQTTISATINGAPEPSPPEEPGPVPAAFSTSSLSISPAEASIGETVTVSILVANTDDLTGSHEVTLEINNVAIVTRDVTLVGGTSQMVSFTTAGDAAGLYEVEIGGQKGEFTVLPAPLVISWWSIGGIIAAVAMISLAIVSLVRRRRSALAD